MKTVESHFKEQVQIYLMEGICEETHTKVQTHAYAYIVILLLVLNILYCRYVQWGKKVFSQPPIVQVLPLKKMREACNYHHRYTSAMTDTTIIRK